LLVALPFVQGVRYLYPVVPFYFYFVVQGVRAGWAIPERWRWLSRGLHGLVLLGVVAYFGFAAGRIARGALAGQNWPPGPLDRDGRAMFAFIQHFTQPADVIVFFKPRAMWLFTGRDSYSADECEKLSGGDYVVIHQEIGPARQVDPVLVPMCYSGVAVYSNPTFVVYKNLAAISN
jgi:hypothetical protein